MSKPNDKLKHDGHYRERVYKIVRRIPRGRVMTYGQIAYILGEGYTPRTVGFAMAGSNQKTSWHRVINSQGRCSTGRVLLPPDKQQRMLENEGVEFNASGSCELPKYLWHPAVEKTKRAASPVRTKLFRRSDKKRSSK